MNSPEEKLHWLQLEQRTNGRYDYVRFDLAGPSYVQFVSVAGYFWFSEFKIFVTSSDDAPDYDADEGLCYAATTTKQTTFSDTYACETYWLHGEFIYFIPNPSENNLMRLNEIEGRGRVAPTPAPVGDDDDDSVDQLDQGSAGAVVLFVAVGLVVLGGAVFGAVKLGKKTSKGAELDSRKAAANNKDDSFGVVSVGNPAGANAMLREYAFMPHPPPSVSSQRQSAIGTEHVGHVSNVDAKHIQTGLTPTRGRGSEPRPLRVAPAHGAARSESVQSGSCQNGPGSRSAAAEAGSVARSATRSNLASQREKCDTASTCPSKRPSAASQW